MYLLYGLHRSQGDGRRPPGSSGDLQRTSSDVITADSPSLSAAWRSLPSASALQAVQAEGPPLRGAGAPEGMEMAYWHPHDDAGGSKPRGSAGSAGNRDAVSHHSHESVPLLDVEGSPDADKKTGGEN